MNAHKTGKGVYIMIFTEGCSLKIQALVPNLQRLQPLEKIRCLYV